MTVWILMLNSVTDVANELICSESIMGVYASEEEAKKRYDELNVGYFKNCYEIFEEEVK